MKRKFEIRYPSDYVEENLAGKPYKPKGKKMIVMNNQGVFFLVGIDDYYMGISKLSDVLHKFDVVWND